MSSATIQTALISVYNKDGLEDLLEGLKLAGVELFSTGGTYDFIKNLGYSVTNVEDVTTYPSILDGRVKTLHPKIFGGILARRDEDHESQLQKYYIPKIDLVVVDLYPFEDTVADTDDEALIIEKIDIGGIALIRAAAKNYKYVTVVPDRKYYDELAQKLGGRELVFTLEERKKLALAAFGVSSHYDSAIRDYFAFGEQASEDRFAERRAPKTVLRYGENPHQEGAFYGDMHSWFEQLNGKPLSYNNLVDFDAAWSLMAEFVGGRPTFAVIKHTNACGLAMKDTVEEAWDAALAGDPVSAFGGVLITNAKVDLATAQKIDKLFYEILAAPDFDEEALALLQKKSKRVVLKVKSWQVQDHQFKSLNAGVLRQNVDQRRIEAKDLDIVTSNAPDEKDIKDLVFANICVKHLKSNAICIVKDEQLLGMGCGQTSRVNALKQAVTKAKNFGFDLQGAVLASDAFFPFDDCVRLAGEAGIKAIVQPGGSMRDQDSIDAANDLGIAMVITGIRHFKH